MKKISTKSIIQIVARITFALSITTLAPMGAQAQKTKFIEASKTVKLVAGQKLKTGDFDRMMRPYTIQRLTDRVYMKVAAKTDACKKAREDVSRLV